MAEITITLPDGSSRDVAADSTVLSLATSISRNLGKAAIAGVVNGQQVDLSINLAQGDSVEIITVDSDRGRHVLRHSTAHVMAQAVLNLYPGAKYTIGPAIENGFYYDFDLGGRVFTEENLANVEAEMRKVIAANQPFVRAEISVADALKLFSEQP